jgi:hypothetical protein
MIMIMIVAGARTAANIMRSMATITAGYSYEWILLLPTHHDHNPHHCYHSYSTNTTADSCDCYCYQLLQPTILSTAVIAVILAAAMIAAKQEL